ncbi:tol-pal system YbgF family protein [bacterium]
MNKHIKRDHSIVKDLFDKGACLSVKQLNAYHKYQVSDEERFRIENHLTDCGLCSEALEGLVLSKSDIHNTLSSLRKGYRDRFQRVDTKQIHWKPYFAMSAIIVLVFASVFTILQQKPMHETLFQEYFQTYPNTTPIVRGDESAGIMENAMIEYEATNYKKALNILENLLNTDPQNAAALFYAGICHLNLKQPDRTIPYLKKVIAGSNIFIEPAGWYLGLAYLRNKELNQAQKIFREITGRDGLYQEDAQKLLQEMNQS